MFPSLKRVCITIPSMLSTRALIIISLLVNLTTLGLFSGARGQLQTIYGNGAPSECMAKWDSDKLKGTNCFSLFIKDFYCDQPPSRGQSVSVGGMSPCLSSLCAVGMSSGGHHEGKGVPGAPTHRSFLLERTKSYNPRRLSSEGSWAKELSPDKECDLRVTQSWPRA